MIVMLIQTEDADAAARVVAQADIEGCVSVVIEDGVVTRPAPTSADHPTAGAQR